MQVRRTGRCGIDAVTGAARIGIEWHGHVEADGAEWRVVAEADACTGANIGEVRRRTRPDCAEVREGDHADCVGYRDTALHRAADIGSPTGDRPIGAAWADFLVGVAAYGAAATKIEAPVGRDICQAGAADNRAGSDLSGQNEPVFGIEAVIAGGARLEGGEDGAGLDLVARARTDRQAVAIRGVQLVGARVAHIFERHAGRQVVAVAEGVGDLGIGEIDTAGGRVAGAELEGGTCRAADDRRLVSVGIKQRSLDACGKGGCRAKSAGFREQDRGGIIELVEFLRLADAVDRTFDAQRFGPAEQVAVPQ